MPPAYNGNLSSSAHDTITLLCMTSNLASPINYALPTILSTSPILPASSHWYLYTFNGPQGPISSPSQLNYLKAFSCSNFFIFHWLIKVIFHIFICQISQTNRKQYDRHFCFHTICKLVSILL